MKCRGLLVLGVLGLLFAGPGTVATWAQCFDNDECGVTQYCQKATGDCFGEGLCSERPLGCPDVWIPVCGCDNTTYANECLAAFAGANVAYEGECQPGPCQDNDDCDTGDYCLKATGDCDGEGTCTPKPLMCPIYWEPVCGCDGTSYDNECLAAFAGVSLAYEGACLPPTCQDNSSCLEDELCFKATGDCNGAGQCAEKPLACPVVWEPVCGCDQVTYGNECLSLKAGINVAYEGECLVSCEANDDCWPTQYCDSAHNGCGETGACRPIPAQCFDVYDPVCGCNELTYDNACLAAMAEVTVFAPGVCGPCPFDPSANCVFTDALESGGLTRWSRVFGD